MFAKQKYPTKLTLNRANITNNSCLDSDLVDISIYQGLSWSWSYGSWIYNYMYNQFLSPLNVVSSNPLHGEV